MILYVIYDHPLDYPDKFVVRRWTSTFEELTPDKEPLAIVDFLFQAREIIPKGYINIGRYEDNDPVILESWADVPTTDVHILLKSSEEGVYVNDDQRIGYQKGAKWMRELWIITMAKHEITGKKSG